MINKIKLWVILASVLFFVFPAWAAENNTNNTSIQQQIKKLQKKVDTQQEQLNKLKSVKEKTHGLKKKPSPLANLHVGGDAILQFRQTNFNDFDPKETKLGGDFAFNSFAVRATDHFNNLYFHTEYVFMSQGNMLNDTWLRYDFSKHWQTKIGLFRRPFGIMPFAYHNFWYDLAYYTGWDDSRQLGLEVRNQEGPLNVQLAFMKNSLTPSSANRMGANLTTGAGAPFPIAGAAGSSNDQQNRMNNEGDLRVTYTFGKGTKYSTGIGASASYGRIYNNITNNFGYRRAFEVHLNGNYGPWQARLEAINYENHPDNPAGVSDQTIQMSYFGVKYLVPAKGNLLIASAARTVPLNWGVIKAVTVYNDFSMNAGYGHYNLGPYQHVGNSYENATGAMWHGGPLQIWTDIILAKNASYAFMGPDNGSWHRRFNVSIGFFF